MLLFGIVIVMRLIVPVRPLTQHGLHALFDSVWSCAFSLGIVLLAAAIGKSIRFRWLPALASEPVLRLTLELSTGFGILAVSVSWLGFFQLLSIPSISCVLLFYAAIAGPQMSRSAASTAKSIRTFPEEFSKLGWLPRVVLTIAAGIGALALLNTLVPAWDYDGLMYHLTGPRDFLAKGGIFPNQDNWYVNGPFSIEMLFSLGLAYGDVLAPKLLHLVFGVLYVLATWGFADRWFGSRSAWITLAILLGLPTLPIWSGFAYIDMAWSLYEWLALASMVEYLRSHQADWRNSTAVFLGLALGTKYLALTGLLVTGLLFLWAMRREKQVNQRLQDAAIAGLVVFCIAGIWYVKNWLWFGNPVYPLYFGGPGWTGVRLELYDAYLKSFGTGTSIRAILALPVTIFTRHAEFGAVMNRNDILSPMFVLAWLYPFTRRKQVTNLLGAAVVLRFGLWILGSQQIRFLLPIDPAIAILAAFVINDAETRLNVRSALSLFLPALAAGLMVITLFYQVQLARQLRPWDVISGRESADEFLVRNVGDYAAARFVQAELPETARALMVGDGRSFYCAPKCIPDPDHFRWASMIDQLEEPAQFGDYLSQNQIDYLFISIEDLDFLLQHDSLQVMRRAVDKVASWGPSLCFQTAYSDVWTTIFLVGCPDGGGS